MKNINIVLITIIGLFLFGCVTMAAEVDKDFVVDSNIVEEKSKNKTISIDPLSFQSLYLILRNGECTLFTATGFIVKKDNINYLVTNWHVLSGRHPATNEILSPTGATPKQILIWHHGKKLGTWRLKPEKLYNDSGEKRWKEHKLGSKVDIVALPLKDISDDIQLYPFNLSLANTDMIPEVAMPVSIIGFPLGFSGPGRFPIWKTGHIASDPDLDYNKEPLFLIDATTRAGMSGSPVVLRLTGGYKKRSDKKTMSLGVPATLFLGIYSGRLPGDIEIGRVWRPYLIEQILQEK